jgi:heme exporter protein A
MYSLIVEGIRKNYTGSVLFENITFSMHEGDVLAITGWNGSGKSTLVRIIAGLVRPSAGRVQMMAGEEPVPKESRRRYLGLAAPAISLYDELTGLENLLFFCKVRGVNGDRAACLEMLKQVGLEKHSNKPCKDYSSGMKQRLKLVQAIIHDPPLLLLDEPGSNLDRKGMKMVEQIISNQRKTGMTIIASNENREVDYADRIINLSE